MIISDNVFRQDERAIYKLRELYSAYGYNHYKVSKFEEYDLYAKNKSFLVSENLLTFTDTNGKLMALKPDITLSIIKNAVANDDASYKLYYDEHVYRTTNSGDGFREIMQTGLECIGGIDLFTECEVIMLALRSLMTVSEDCLLDLSHMRFIEGLLESAGIANEDMSDYIKLMGTKNLPALRALCAAGGVDEVHTDRICGVTAMYLPIERALEELSPMVEGEKMSAAYGELCDIYEVMRLYGNTDSIRLDLSVVNDMNYYDGIIFKGFVNGIPDSILSGGRYDRLMERFGKKTEAIGFAVYLDRLERFGNESREYDVDILLVYGEDTEPQKIIETVRELTADGSSVRTARTADGNLRYRRLVTL